jgi:PAS domain S-box-containing protein
VVTSLADLLEARLEATEQRWQERSDPGGHGEAAGPALLDRAGFLRDLILVLRGQKRVEDIARGSGEGAARYRGGFDVGALLREYRELRHLLIDLGEQKGGLTLAEMYVLGEFFPAAMAEGAAEYSRQREQLTRAHEQQERVAAEVERQKIYALFMQSPVATCIVEGPRHVFTFANAAYRERVGGRELIGKPLLEARPELNGQGFEAILDRVLATGEPFFGKEWPILLDREGTGEREEAFINFAYSPKRNAQGEVDGIIATSSDVTEQVRARHRAEALAGRLLASEERLRLVLEGSGIGTWELDLATGEVVADAGFRALFGLASDDLFVGPKGLGILHPDDSPRARQAVADVLAGKHGGVYRVEYRTYPSTDRPSRWIEARGQAFFGPTGEARRFLGTVVDITERKQVEESRAQQRRHDALAAQVGFALAHSATLREMLQSCAQALVDQLGAALTRCWLVHPREPVLELQTCAGASRHAEGAHERVPIGHLSVGLIAQERCPLIAALPADDPRLADLAWAGREGLVAFAGYPLVVGDKLVGVLDLFARRPIAPATAEVLGRLVSTIALGVERLRAEGALKARADFEQHLVGIVSHDLRNPLNAILLGAGALTATEELDSRSLRIAARIRSSAERATRLVSDLPDFTQARLGGGIAVRPGPLDLHALVRQVVEEIEGVHHGRDIQLRQEGDGLGYWDSDRLAQVVGNLLSNALKYSPQGSPVQVVTRAEDSWICLSIRNQGAPISAHMRERIFEPLQRATAEVDRSGRSVGLGLYIVRHIVLAHGGTIAVASDETSGTLFSVSLPRHGPPEGRGGPPG